MKKVLFFIFLFILSINHCFASNKMVVTLNKCVDGDTAWFNLDGEVIKTRFLAIDTPESTNKKEAFGEDASKYTCNLLTNSSKIEIEYDPSSEQQDKYERHLVWVFVDNELLQDLIIKEGLAEVAYLYGDYKYTNILKASELLAKTTKLGIWQDSNDTLYIILGIIILILIIILCIFNEKFRNKVFKKLKSKIKKEIKKIT